MSDHIDCSGLVELWDKLRAKSMSEQGYITELRIDGYRGIKTLTIPFKCPVSVLAGKNGCGKSSALFALCHAYPLITTGVGEKNTEHLFMESAAPPDVRQKDTGTFTIRVSSGDAREKLIIPGQMIDGINIRRSECLLEGGDILCVRMLRESSGIRHHVTGDEPRSILTASDSESQADFATEEMKRVQQIVTQTPYNNIMFMPGFHDGDSNLLVTKSQGIKYWEWNMSSGERATIRLLSQLRNMQGGLVLIDDIESGLHPEAQQRLMHNLLHLAHENNLQVIVTTHSNSILGSVPAEGRILLNREPDGSVSVLEPFSDVIQELLYGAPKHRFCILCEDEVAQGLLEGVLNVLERKGSIPRRSVKIYRGAGAEEFSVHALAFKKYEVLDDFVFVLDGDKKGDRAENSLRKNAGGRSIYFLPGTIPEKWILEFMQASGMFSEQEFHGNLQQTYSDIKSIEDEDEEPRAKVYKDMLGKVAEISSVKIRDMCVRIAIDVVEGNSSASPSGTELIDIANGLEGDFINWRKRSLRG